MPRLRRTQILIQEDQHQGLAALAKRERRTISHVVRRLIDEHLSREALRSTRPGEPPLPVALRKRLELLDRLGRQRVQVFLRRLAAEIPLDLLYRALGRTQLSAQPEGDGDAPMRGPPVPAGGGRAVVVDGFLALRLLLPVQPERDGPPLEETVLALFQTWARDERALAAPTPWLSECSQAMARLAEWGELQEGEADQALQALFQLGVEAHPDSPELSRAALRWSRTVPGLDLRDGLYLALAQLLDGEVWTGDPALARAAARSGAVRVYTPTPQPSD